MSYVHSNHLEDFGHGGNRGKHGTKIVRLHEGAFFRQTVSGTPATKENRDAEHTGDNGRHGLYVVLRFGGQRNGEDGGGRRQELCRPHCDAMGLIVEFNRGAKFRFDGRDLRADPRRGVKWGRRRLSGGRGGVGRGTKPRESTIGHWKNEVLSNLKRPKCWKLGWVVDRGVTARY